MNNFNPQTLHFLLIGTGLTRKDAAKAIGVDITTLINWLSGKRKPTDANLHLMCEFFNVPADHFFKDIRQSTHDLLQNQHYKILHQDTPLAHRTAVDTTEKVFGPLFTEPEEEVETQALDHWKKDTILPFHSQNCVDFWEFEGDEILIRGPARCGKSTLILEWAIAMMFKHDGIQIIVARAFGIDLDAVRQNIKDIVKYRFADPLSPIEVVGGEKFTKVRVKNSEMLLKGIDRSEGQLGAGYDIGIFSQAEQIKKESVDIISSRITPASQNWVEDGVAKSLIIYDANPNRLDNWIEEQIKNGLYKIDFTFTDHPGYFKEDGSKTALYDSVYSRLDRMEGVQRKRLLEGIAANPEGNVFDIQEAHLLDELPEDLNRAYNFYRGMDFGMKDPNVCLWFAHHRQKGDLIIFREYRKTGEDQIEFGNQVKAYTDERIIATVIDHPESNQSLLMKNCGIPTILAQKGPESINSGITLIHHRMNATIKGQDGGLYFYNNPVIRDPRLVKDNEPLTIIDEGELYSWDENNDKPIDKHNHGWDVVRYICDYLESAQPAIGFGGTGVKRKRRVN